MTSNNRLMEKGKPDQMRQAEQDLRRLKQEQKLPPLMEFKLCYLQALLQNSPEQGEIGEKLEQFEREAIEDLPVITKRKVFLQTIKCLSGRQVMLCIRGERAYLRRQGKFFSWEKCYITCTNNTMTLFPKRDSRQSLYQWELQRVCLSKYYKRYKGKYVLALYCEGIKFVIGFDEEITCKRVHEIMGQFIAQKREWQATKYDNNKFLEEKEAQRLALPQHRVRHMINQEEYQRIQILEKRVNNLDLMSDEGFELQQNLKEGRVMVGKDCVKTQIIVKGLDPFKAAACYIQMAKWNPSIQTFEVTGRPRTNCLTATLKTRKYSMLSYARGVKLVINFFRPCQCNKNQSSRYYLLLEELPSEEAVSGTVGMSLKQVVQFTPNKQDPSLLLVMVLTKANFKGYCTQADNKAMNLNLSEQIEHFCDFVRNVGPDDYLGYFQDMVCPCLGMIDNCEVSLPTQRQDIPESLRSSIKMVKLQFQLDESGVIAVMGEVCQGVINEQIIKILKNRVHERYYLRHRFVETDETFEMEKGAVRNFLKEGSRWQFKGDQLVFIDAEALAAQKDILRMILKQISSNIMQGKSVMNMSLPVQIFDRRSLLDAIADSYGFLPGFLPRIETAKNALQEMKQIVCSFMFIHTTCPTVEKPFNPILGETYQGRLGSLSVSIQQISHHPPISSFFISNSAIEVWGNVEIVIDFGINTVDSYLSHWVHTRVKKTGSEYFIKLPDIEFGGLLYGERNYRVTNRGFIFEKKSCLFCQFSIGKDKKRVYEVKPKMKFADLAGGIFRVKDDFGDKVIACPKPKTFEGLKPENIIQTCCLITGKWYGDIFFDNVCYKSKKEGPFPVRAQRLKYVLPSDSFWRTDVIYKIWKNNEISNRQKERLENLQRNDRKLRQKFKKNK